MTSGEEIAFCNKRISEQMDYINETSKRTDISNERKGELLESAMIVRRRFVARLRELLNL